MQGGLPINGLIVDGMFHRLVESSVEQPCKDCSMSDKCWNDSDFYICELFGKPRMKFHFEKAGEMRMVRTMPAPFSKD